MKPFKRAQLHLNSFPRFHLAACIIFRHHFDSMASPPIVSALPRRLEGKVALITGGASGIGESTAKLFARHGAKVVIADIQDELAHSVVHSIGPSNCMFVHCDVTNEDHVRTSVDAAVSAYGKLDIMFNNAGIGDASMCPITDYNTALFHNIMNVNVAGVFLGMKHAARVMVPARQGAIISTASLVSQFVGSSTHAYACSKHAVLGLTKSLAVELGQFGVRVNCVSPYGVATPLVMKIAGTNDVEAIEEQLSYVANLKGVVLKAEDVANAALFLASDEAKYVNGHNLLVDGGLSVGTNSLFTSKRP